MRLRDLPIERYAAYVIVLVGLFWFAGWLIPPLLLAALPFLLAWGMAYLSRPIALRIARYTHMPRGVLSVLLVFLFVSGLCVLLFFGLRRAAAELLAFGRRLGEAGTLDAALSRFGPLWQELCDRFPFFFEAKDGGAPLSDWLSRAAGAIGEWALSVAGRLLSALPSFFLFLTVALCAAFYFALDLDGIHRSFRTLLSPRAQDAMGRIKDGAWYTALGYLRAYLILAAITFGLLTVGFLSLGVHYALLLALLFAALDFLPVIGVNILLIPWGIFELLTGNYFLGFGLLILCGVIALVRQFVEPRIISRRFGIHPLASLAGMYFGLRFLGFFGLLFGPVLAMALQRTLSEWRAGRGGGEKAA